MSAPVLCQPAGVPHVWLQRLSGPGCVCQRCGLWRDASRPTISWRLEGASVFTTQHALFRWVVEEPAR